MLKQSSSAANSSEPLMRTLLGGAVQRGCNKAVVAMYIRSASPDIIKYGLRLLHTELDRREIAARISNKTTCTVSYGHGTTTQLVQPEWTVGIRLKNSTGDSYTYHSTFQLTGDTTWALTNTTGEYYYDYYAPNETFLGIYNPVLALGHVTASFDGNGSATPTNSIAAAEECVLSLCDISSNTTMKNGSLRSLLWTQTSEPTCITNGTIPLPSVAGRPTDHSASVTC